MMCDDSIRRSDVIDELMHIIPYKRYHNGEYILLLNKKECLSAIKTIPTADRSRGSWIYQFRDSENEEYKCSECDYPVAVKHKYCPNCGADMRMKGVDDE